MVEQRADLGWAILVIELDMRKSFRAALTLPLCWQWHQLVSRAARKGCHESNLLGRGLGEGLRGGL